MNHREDSMKRFVGVSMVLGLFLVGNSAADAQAKKPANKGMPAVSAQVGTDDIIAKITRYREENEKKLLNHKLTKKEVAFKGETIKEALKQQWEKMDAYYEGNQLVRIQLYPHKGISERTEEFYLKDNKLVFAFIQDKGPKHEGRDIGEPGKEFYFDNDLLIKFLDRSGEEEKDFDSEQKMYEYRLPYEIKELLEILNRTR